MANCIYNKIINAYSLFFRPCQNRPCFLCRVIYFQASHYAVRRTMEYRTSGRQPGEMLSMLFAGLMRRGFFMRAFGHKL